MNEKLIRLIEKYPDLEECLPELQAALGLLKVCYQNAGKVLVCGNGGSAADSEHIVGELMKGYLLDRPVPEAFSRRLREAYPVDGAYLAERLQGALPAISLVSQSSLLTAYANDVAADMIFAQQVYGYGRPGDVLIGISASGNARNVLYALQVARALELKTIGLTGATGGDMRPVCDAVIGVPWQQIADIQERHVAVYHALCAILEEEFFAPSGEES